MPHTENPADDAQVLEIGRDGDVTLLTLRREERRNALNLELCRAIWAAAQAAVADGSRVLVITGRGSVFSAGADLGGVYSSEFLEALYSMLHGLGQLPIPVIAAVNGPAIGAGTQLAMACDLRMVDETARFAVPTAKNGMAVDGWTIRTLERLAGAGRARRVMLSADTIERDEALACGLADRPGGVEDAVRWAKEIAVLAPLSLAHNKLILNGGSDDDVNASFEAVWASEDVKEAARARDERRPPVFRGT